MMCYEYDNIKPDIVLLGKALSGGGTKLNGRRENDDADLSTQYIRYQQYLPTEM